jgi:hypothetical protein
MCSESVNCNEIDYRMTTTRRHLSRVYLGKHLFTEECVSCAMPLVLGTTAC